MLAVPMPTSAHEYIVGGIKIDHPWAPRDPAVLICGGRLRHAHQHRN